MTTSHTFTDGLEPASFMQSAHAFMRRNPELNLYRGKIRAPSTFGEVNPRVFEPVFETGRYGRTQNPASDLGQSSPYLSPYLCDFGPCKYGRSRIVFISACPPMAVETLTRARRSGLVYDRRAAASAASRSAEVAVQDAVPRACDAFLPRRFRSSATRPYLNRVNTGAATPAWKGAGRHGC